jgi:hypothetical protein
VIEKATNSSKQNLIEVFCESVGFWLIRRRASKLDALLAKAAIKITTSKLCRIVSMHGLDEASWDTLKRLMARRGT